MEALLGATAGGGFPPAAGRERASFGIAGLDGMLHGGLLRGSATVLLGPPGSGKTLLGLHFLAQAARQDEPALYFGLNEPPPVLIDAGDQIGLEFTRLVAEGRLEVLWHPATEADLDALAQQLLTRVRERHIRSVFIDGLDAFSDLSLYAERIAPFFTALTNELRAAEVTTVTSLELNYLFGPSVEIPIDGVSAIAENIIFLRYVELRSQLYRLISVLKTRRSGHDVTLREFTIDDGGITIASTFAPAEAILTGLARPLSAGAQPSPKAGGSSGPAS